MLEISTDLNLYKEEIITLEKKYLTGSLQSFSLNDRALILIDNGNFLGYLLYSLVLDEAEIISICLKEAARAKGYGKLLFNKLIENNDIKDIFLEVSSNNKKAYFFYLSQGFTEISQRKQYYCDGSDALILKWSR